MIIHMAGDLCKYPQMLTRILFRTNQKEEGMDRFIYTFWTDEMFIHIDLDPDLRADHYHLGMIDPGQPEMR